MYAPGTASNAGGVICDSLEIAQNLQRESWSDEALENKLKQSMKDIYYRCADTAKKLGKPGDIATGAYTASFKRLADAMFEQGMV